MHAHRPSRRTDHLLPASFALVATLLVTTGCQIGPGALKVANAHDSDAVRVSGEEQLLVNLVRLRYRDSPVFLGVSSISTQFNFGVAGDISGTINEGAGNVLGLGAGVSYEERPTISFSILGGEKFQKHMLTPLDVIIVALLAESGWRVDRVLRLAVEGLNGLPNAPKASGPTPTAPPEFGEFIEATSLLRKLTEQRKIDFKYETREESILEPILATRVEAADLVDAARAGIEFKVSEDGDRVGLVTERRRLVLRFDPEFDTLPDVIRLREILHLDASRRRVYAVGLEDAQFDPFEPDRRLENLAIDTRSLMGVLYDLSNGVNPPQEHIDAGLVTATKTVESEVFDWNELLDGLFRVHSSRDRPLNASVVVRHRGHWFYIEDADETSRSTFLLLGQMFALQAGDVDEVKTVLALPVGG